MSLTTALNVAQSALFATSRQTSVVARNVTEAQNPDYARRIAVQTNQAPGVQSTTIERATNQALFRQNLVSISAYEGQSSVYAGLDQLGLSVNGVDNAASAAIAIGSLQEALQFYAATPSNRSLAENAVEMARQTARSLNDGTNAIQSFRSQTDADISTAVNELNGLLADFDLVNTAVVKGAQSGRDVSNELDRRDSLLKDISKYVSISTYTRGANDMVITTKDGATLFETSPRAVTFAATPAYGANSSGNPILIDGVPVQAGTGGNTSATGKLAGLLQLRDTVAPAMQSQLDEVARGLISAFRETGAGPDAAGLFTWSGAPSLPADGVVIAGLAGQITINPAMDSSAGGNPHLLRDGGANGAAYVANTTGGASFSDLLLTYSDRMDEPVAFDLSAGAGTGMSVAAYSAGAIGWFEALRKDAASGEETKNALVTRTTETLSNITGVNIDEEMAMLLDLEHSYEASARLIKAVDDMLASLLSAVR